MKHRKNIDQLYKNTLADAEVKPPVDAWNNIASRLPEKQQKKRVLPLWYKLAGAAAVILLLLAISNTYFSSSAKFEETPISSENDTFEQELNGAEPENSIQSDIAGENVTTDDSQIAENDKTSGNKYQPEDSHIPLKHDDQKVQLPDPLTGSTPSETTEANPDALAEVSERNQDPIPSPSEEEIPSIVEQSTEPQLEESNALGALANSETAEEYDSEDTKGRFSISTKASPVYFNTSGKGNGAPSMDTGEASVSYGVQVAYQITDKLSLRSGLQMMDLNFSKPGVPVDSYTGIASKKREDILVLSSPMNGDLKQDLNFLEVPLEMEYSLLDRQVSLNLIGGGSLLFLNSNELSLESPVGLFSVQEPEGQDPMSFTTNIGVGLGYELFTQFELNLEPMVKFPIGSSTPLSSYYFGMYSGFKYRF